MGSVFMKKITLILLVSLAIIGFLVFCAEPLMQEQIPEVYTETLAVRDVYEIVKCQGTVDSENKEGISTGAPAEVIEIYVSEGDTVIEGQLLMRYRLLTSDEIYDNFTNLYFGELAKIMESAYNDLSTQSLLAAVMIYSATGEIPAFFRDYYLPKTSSSTQTTYGELRAEINGTVTNVNHSAGDKISGVWDPFCILDTSALIAKLNVPEAYASKVEIGQPVNISSDAIGSIVLPGYISEIMPYAETIGGIFTSQSTIVSCTVKISDTQGLLKQGNSIQAQIFCSKYADTFLIPYECISQENGSEYVYVYYQGRAYKKTISALFENDKGVVPVEPFFEGAELIVNPGDNLCDACKVMKVEDRES